MEFDLRSYIESSDSDYIETSNDEMRLNCFAPNGCASSDTGHHLYVNTDKNMWFCFKCGYGDTKQQKGTASLARFISDLDDISSTKAHMIIEKQHTVSEDEFETELLKAFAETVVKEKETKTIQLPKEFFKIADKSYPSMGFADYVKKRGLSFSDFYLYDMRYCTSSRSGDWQGRIIFPVHDEHGNICSAVGRSIFKGKGGWYIWPHSNISNVVWPMYKFKFRAKKIPIPRHVVLVEGVFDAIAVDKLTPYKGLCTFGKKISSNQVNLLRRLGVDSVVIAWDFDAIDSIRKFIRHLSGFFKVYVFPFKSSYWQQNYDFGDILASRNNELINMLNKELEEVINANSEEFISWCLQ